MSEASATRRWRTFLRINWFGRRELHWLAALLVFSAAIWLFVELAGLATAAEPHALDERLLLMLRSGADGQRPLGPQWLVEAARDITALGSVAVLALATLAAAMFLVLRREARSALVLILSIAGGVALSFVLKSGFDRPRPDLVAHEVATFTSSFPSAHSMASAVAYLTLGAVLARFETRLSVKVYVMTIAVLLAVIIGISRVYLGVHWPSDVLAGWTAGAAWALVCWFMVALVRHFRPRRESDSYD